MSNFLTSYDQIEILLRLRRILLSAANPNIKRRKTSANDVAHAQKNSDVPWESKNGRHDRVR
jgi:hypothetical protein